MWDSEDRSCQTTLQLTWNNLKDRSRSRDFRDPRRDSGARTSPGSGCGTSADVFCENTGWRWFCSWFARNHERSRVLARYEGLIWFVSCLSGFSTNVTSRSGILDVSTTNLKRACSPWRRDDDPASDPSINSMYVVWNGTRWRTMLSAEPRGRRQGHVALRIRGAARTAKMKTKTKSGVSEINRPMMFFNRCF